MERVLESSHPHERGTDETYVLDFPGSDSIQVTRSRIPTRSMCLVCNSLRALMPCSVAGVSAQCKLKRDGGGEGGGIAVHLCESWCLYWTYKLFLYEDVNNTQPGIVCVRSRHAPALSHPSGFLGGMPHVAGVRRVMPHRGRCCVHSYLQGRAANGHLGRAQVPRQGQKCKL